MKNNKNQMIKPINFESESIDITHTCCNVLYTNNFYHNNNLKNIELLESILSNYSTFKVLSWKQSIPTNIINKVSEANTLEDINNIISEIISKEEQKKAYFVQYIHCIIYVLGVINDRHQIKWIEEDTEEITIQSTNENIEAIITPKNIPYEQLILKLIAKIKTIYEKGPVLKK